MKELQFNEIIETLLNTDIHKFVFKNLNKSKISITGEISGISYYAMLYDSESSLFFTFRVCIDGKMTEVADFSLGGYDYKTAEHHYGIFQRRGWWMEKEWLSKKSQNLYNRLSKKFIKSFEKYYLTK